MITLQEILDSVEDESFRELCQSVCACLRELDSRYDWVGIYWLKGETLTLGPWSGPQETEHTKISIDAGICGAAAREGKTIIVDDVQSDPLYLACFADTRSEIVVPIRKNKKIIGEIDIDGKEKGLFGPEDQKLLEELADHIGKQWPGKW